jgi:hypothetical protein
MKRKHLSRVTRNLRIGVSPAACGAPTTMEGVSYQAEHVTCKRCLCILDKKKRGT